MASVECAVVVPIADVAYPQDLGQKVRIAGLYVATLT